VTHDRQRRDADGALGTRGGGVEARRFRRLVRRAEGGVGGEELLGEVVLLGAADEPAAALTVAAHAGLERREGGVERDFLGLSVLADAEVAAPRHVVDDRAADAGPPLGPFSSAKMIFAIVGGGSTRLRTCAIPRRTR
jgi:hypothetical protein